MLELLEKIELLKKSLDEDSIIKSLKECQEDIMQDTLLMKQIKNHDKLLESKEKIKELRRLENDVNFIILEINQYLKENIIKNSRCQNENN